MSHGVSAQAEARAGLEAHGSKSSAALAPSQRSVLWVGTPDGLPGPLPESDALQLSAPYSLGQVQLAVARGEFQAALIDVDVGDAAFDVVLQLNEADTPCRSVIIGSTLEPAMVREAFMVGVIACLRKPVAPPALLRALHQACEATIVMQSCIRSLGIPEPAAPHRVDLEQLTPREREVLRFLLEGRTTSTIADEIAVTRRTVKFHVSNVLRKLGASSRLSLMAKLRGADVF